MYYEGRIISTVTAVPFMIFIHTESSICICFINGHGVWLCIGAVQLLCNKYFIKFYSCHASHLLLVGYNRPPKSYLLGIELLSYIYVQLCYSTHCSVSPDHI